MLTGRWAKSSRSCDSATCVEARLTGTWRKSSYSCDSTCCVEARHTTEAVEVRDTKDAAGPSLRFTPGAWTAFLHTIQD